MAKAVIMGSGGGGASSDELTAARGDVLKGKTAVTSDSNDDPVEGTLELTGDLSAVDAKKGTTFYNTDAKKKETGMLEEKTSVYEGAGTLDGTSKRLQLSIPTRAIYTAASKIYATYANIASLIGLTAAKLAQGQSVLGMTGTYKGRGNATAAQVLSGYTFSTASLDNASGTMPNQGAKTASLNAGGSYVIPAGYHNGSGRVTAIGLAAQTGGATAADGDVLSGKTYWKDGTKRTGSMVNRGALNVTLNPGGSQGVSAGYYSGGTIRANAAGNPCISGTMTPNAIYAQGQRAFKKADGSSINRNYIKITGALSGGKTLRGFSALGETTDDTIIGAIYTGSGNPYAIRAKYKYGTGDSGNFKPSYIFEYNLASCISGNDVYIPMQSSSSSTSHSIRYFCVAN